MYTDSKRPHPLTAGRGNVIKCDYNMLSHTVKDGKDCAEMNPWLVKSGKSKYNVLRKKTCDGSVTVCVIYWAYHGSER